MAVFCFVLRHRNADLYISLQEAEGSSPRYDLRNRMVGCHFSAAWPDAENDLPDPGVVI
ncbi:hypothetical protein D3C81_2227020 [compost metagenome]